MEKDCGQEEAKDILRCQIREKSEGDRRSLIGLRSQVNLQPIQRSKQEKEKLSHVAIASKWGTTRGPVKTLLFNYLLNAKEEDHESVL